MAIGLTGVGVENVIVCTDDDGPARNKPDLSWATEMGIRVFVFPRQTRFYSFSGGMARWLFKKVGDFDIVHVHSIFNFPSVAACLISRFRKKPYILKPLGILSEWGFANRHPFLKPLSFRFIEREMFLNAYAVHVTSDLERKAVEGFLQRDKQMVVIPDFVARLIVIPEPTDLQAGDVINPAEATQVTRTVLFMSRVDPKKNVEVLIAAFQTVLQRLPNARLLIVGPGDPAYVESLKKQVNALGLDNFVTWRGFVGGAEKWEILRNASVLVLPSHAENFAVIVLEALSVNTLVVISENVGLADCIKEATAGVVTTTNPDDVAKGILTLLMDVQLAAQCRTNGRTLIDQQFSQTAVIDKLTNMYAAALRS